MTYWNWVLLGRLAGEGLDAAGEYNDKMDVLQEFMIDVLSILQALLVTGTSDQESGDALEEAGCKFMTDIGYEDYAIEIMSELGGEL